MAWKRLNKSYDTQLISNLVINVGAPCLVLSTLSHENVKLADLETIGAAAAGFLAVIAVMGTGLIWIAKAPYRPYLPILIFGNTGNLGLPLCLFAFGKEGLALGIVFYVISSMLLFTVGGWLWSGAYHPTAFLKTPLIYSVLTALILLVTGLHFPTWLSRAIHLIGQITIPLMLITLGVSLCNLKVTHFGRVLLVALLRLGLGFAVGLLIVDLLGMKGIPRGVVLLESTTPVAVFNFLFASRYNRRADEVAGVVVISTLVFLLVLPGLLIYV